jgi:hypothetical protein
LIEGKDEGRGRRMGGKWVMVWVMCVVLKMDEEKDVSAVHRDEKMRLPSRSQMR